MSDRMATNIIHAQSLRLGFSNRVLIDGLDFELAPSGQVGLTGRSGLGKSTLLDAIVQKGLRRPACALQSGSLEVHAGPIGYAPQETAIPESFSVGALRDGLIARAPSNRRERLRGLFRDFGLDMLAGSYPRTLSGGERQRLSLAIALTLVGDLLILDEPLTELDPATKAETLQGVSAFLYSENVALILVSHDLDILLRLCQTVHVLGPRGITHSIERNGMTPEQFLARRRDELFEWISASEPQPESAGR